MVLITRKFDTKALEETVEIDLPELWTECICTHTQSALHLHPQSKYCGCLFDAQQSTFSLAHTLVSVFETILGLHTGEHVKGI